jgi:LysR family transcriptional regulator, transcriptional activator of the cysJI operon
MLFKEGDMLKDFVKMETFLTTVRERSFSKASAKLGVSQPAVTQQIKFIEKQLGATIVERKKNGIRLTAEGEELYKIITRLEKAIQVAEKDLLKIVDNEITFRIGASYTIGTYVIPGQCLNDLRETIHNDVSLSLGSSQDIINQLKDKKLDIGLIESPIMDNELIHREWLQDELVIVSNVPIPKFLQTEDLQTFSWICREEASHTRKMVTEVFEDPYLKGLKRAKRTVKSRLFPSSLNMLLLMMSKRECFLSQELEATICLEISLSFIQKITKEIPM